MSTSVDVALAALLMTWIALSAGHMCGAPWLTTVLGTFSRLHLVVDWTMFSTGNRSLVGSRFWFEFREGPEAGALPTEWKVFADTSTAWLWHSFVWDPQRRLADRLRIIGKELRQAHTMEPPAQSTVDRLNKVLHDHLQEVHPCTHATRQIRLCIDTWDAAADGTLKRRFIELNPVSSKPRTNGPLE